jgi:hypothetical protein
MERAKAIRQGISKSRAGGTIWGANGAVLAKHNAKAADAFAHVMEPILIEVLLSYETYGKAARVAQILNDLGHQAPRGGEWYASTVIRLTYRLGPALKTRLEAERQARCAVYKKNMDIKPL